MASAIPETTKQWALRAQGSFDNLKLETAPIPALGEFDVLVKIHAASLNYRDLMIAMVCRLDLPLGFFHLPEPNSDKSFEGNILLAY